MMGGLMMYSVTTVIFATDNRQNRPHVQRKSSSKMYAQYECTEYTTQIEARRTLVKVEDYRLIRTGCPSGDSKIHVCIMKYGVD